ncbi:hypothetical protein [Sphingomonas sp.]|uniref:hypothetical protein n=1 Tax=Sphingomonas sp. TaxID=28214 RepID=UPI002DD6A20B|nr:hypothetical protein [Sphingomonas sp.]
MKTLAYENVGPDPRGSTIRTLVDAALGDARLPIGTPAADAIYGLFLSEARQKGWDMAEKAWSEIDAETIRAIAQEFELMAWQGNRMDYPLPAGTEMIACIGGFVIVDAEQLGVDIDRPGLHHSADMPGRPGGSNLDLLMRIIEELSANLACRAIGMPELVVRLVDRHPEHHLQFPPFAPADNLVLQRSMDFSSSGLICSFDRSEIETIATGVVSDMSRLYASPHIFASRIRNARRAVEAMAAHLPDVHVRAMTLDISNQYSQGDILAAEFEAWDHAFRRGIVVHTIGQRFGWSAPLDVPGLDRADTVAAVHAKGAHGWVSGVARSILEAAPGGPAAALAELAEGFETNVVLATSTRPLKLRLFWRHGVIRVATRDGDGVEVTDEVLTLRRQAFPETVITALKGQPLHAVLDSPFRCGSRIEHAENKDGNVVVRIKPDPWLVNCENGQMWPDAPAKARRTGVPRTAKLPKKG